MPSKNKPKLVGKVTTTILTGYTQYTEGQIMLFLCVEENGRNGARRRQEQTEVERVPESVLQCLPLPKT